MKWLLAILLFVFTCTVVPFSNAKTITIEPSVAAEKSASVPAIITDEEEGTVQKVEYTLPYPGILPDHPLYFIKKFRDFVMEKLIADPVRKIEFYVLQGDKLTNMGTFLTEKGKDALAFETVTLGAERMETAISTATTLKAEGKEIPAYLIEKLTNASKKHQEVVNALSLQASGELKDRYTEFIVSMRTIQDKIAKLKG